MVGASLIVGESLSGHADARVGAALHLAQALGDGYQLGVDARASIEGFTGGFGCGTLADDGRPVPAVGVVCLAPGAAVHAFLGRRVATSKRSWLALDAGPGASAEFTIPGQGGRTQVQLRPSVLARIALLVDTGEALGARWSIGLGLEESVQGICAPQHTGGLGLIVEAR